MLLSYDELRDLVAQGVIDAPEPDQWGLDRHPNPERDPSGDPPGVSGRGRHGSDGGHHR